MTLTKKTGNNRWLSFQPMAAKIEAVHDPPALYAWRLGHRLKSTI